MLSKILFISYTFSPPYFGGGLNRIIKTLESLKARGHQVNVFTSGVPGYPEKDNIKGININRSPFVGMSKVSRGIRRLLFPIWVRSKLIEFQPDIVHIEGLGGLNPLAENLALMVLNTVARRVGAITIKQHTLADSEDEMFSVAGFNNRLRLCAWNKLDAIVSVSPALHEAVSHHLSQKSYCIMNGVDTKVYSPLEETERANFRKNLGKDDNDVIFTFLGSIGYRKGFDLLANAFADLSQDHPNWHLWVIGPGSKAENRNINVKEVAELRSILSPCEQRVKYWGRIDDEGTLAKILAASDVFVFPSRREGFPNAPLEAMASGLPLIIAKINGVTDQANIEGKTGFYCEVDDLDSLKRAMVKLGTDQNLRKRMGIAARKRVVEKFGWDAYIGQWEQLYQSLLAGKS